MHPLHPGRRTCRLRLRGAARAATLLVVVLMGVTSCGASDPVPPGTSDAASSRSSTRPAPRAVPEVLTAGRSTPTTLSIPTIGVRSRLMGLGIEPDGALEVPPGGFPAGWFTGAPTPGELGPAVIAGHVHWVDGPGVFWRLGELRRGDAVSLTRRDGSTVRFRVTAVKTFAKNRFPTKQVYGDIDHAGLRLITCGGYDKGSASYESNVVVFAELIAVREG